jgi:hypothetical protein
MTKDLDVEDIELDARWRDLFGEPLPIRGAHAIVRHILETTDPDSLPVRGKSASNVICLASRRAGRG